MVSFAGSDSAIGSPDSLPCGDRRKSAPKVPPSGSETFAYRVTSPSPTRVSPWHEVAGEVLKSVGVAGGLSCEAANAAVGWTIPAAAISKPSAADAVTARPGRGLFEEDESTKSSPFRGG